MALSEYSQATIARAANQGKLGRTDLGTSALDMRRMRRQVNPAIGRDQLLFEPLRRQVRQGVVFVGLGRASLGTFTHFGLGLLGVSFTFFTDPIQVA